MILTSVNVCVGAIFRTTQYRIPTRLSTKRKNVERVSVVVEQKRRELNPFQMSYCWQIHTLASKALVPIPQSQFQSLFFPYSHSHSSICVGLSRRVPCSRLQEMSVVESSSQYQYQQQQQQSTTTDYYPSVRDDEEGEGISKIRVPRQKHIPVSKSQLLDAIILSIQDDIDAHHFRLLTS